MTQSIDQLHLLILNVGLAIHNADWNWKNVSSPFTRLYYIMEGTAQIIFPDGMQELKPHHLYLVPSFTTHSYQCNSHFTHYYLHIYEDHQSESGILEDWNFPIEIPAGNLELPLIKRLCEINPTMQLPQSDPTSYDNNPTLDVYKRQKSSHSCCRGKVASLAIADSQSKSIGVSTIMNNRLPHIYISISKIPTERIPSLISRHDFSLLWHSRYFAISSGSSFKSIV